MSTPAQEGIVLRPDLRRHFLLSLLTFPALAAIGAVGYRLIEGWSLSDSLFMAATTITTVGYGEVHPLSERGRLFTIALLLVGLATVWYTLSVLVRVVLEGELGLNWEARRMERQIAQARDHHIVTGYGRVGRQIAQALGEMGHHVVVIEADAAAVHEALADGYLVVEGNATEDEILLHAGIARAAALIAALGSDADNVFVTLSARALHATLPIVARANDRSAIPKLTRAGATQAVSPYDAASRQMARLALRPGTVDFIESLFQGTSDTLVVENVRVEPDSPLVGMTARQLKERVRHAALIAVLRDGEAISPPGPDFAFASGDEIAAVGTEMHLRRLEDVSQAPNRKPALSRPGPEHGE